PARSLQIPRNTPPSRSFHALTLTRRPPLPSHHSYFTARHPFTTLHHPLIPPMSPSRSPDSPASPGSPSPGARSAHPPRCQRFPLPCPQCPLRAHATTPPRLSMPPREREGDARRDNRREHVPAGARETE